MAYVVEAHFDWNAETASGAREDVSESEGEAGGGFAEVDEAGAVERVGVAADVVLAVQRDGAAGGDQGGCLDAVVVGEDELRAHAEPSPEGEPVERGVAGHHVEVDGDVGTLLLKAGGIGEEVGAGAEVELSREWRGYVEACSSEPCLRGDAYLRKRAKGFWLDDA